MSHIRKVVSTEVVYNGEAIDRLKKLLEGKVKAHSVNHRLAVGIQGPGADDPKLDYNGDPTNETVVDNAFNHEMGRGVPERSWLRAWFDTNKESLNQSMTFAARRATQERENGRDPLPIYIKYVVALSNQLKSFLRNNSNGNEPLSRHTEEMRLEAGLEAGPPLVATKQTLSSIWPSIDGQIIVVDSPPKAAHSKKEKKVDRGKQVAKLVKQTKSKLTKLKKSATKVAKKAIKSGKKTAKGIKKDIKKALKPSRRTRKKK